MASQAPPPHTEVSSTRLYLGNLSRLATKADVENHFSQNGSGKITEVKLMSGFGFIEYEDELDARDAVPNFHGTQFMNERLIVQFAKGSRREPYHPHERPPPRPRRTPYKMTITGLPVETSWQDLKDFARGSGLDVVYSEVSRDRDGRGFVEYETLADLQSAVEKLDSTDFKGQAVHCAATPQDERTFRDRHRSRSPGPYRRGGYPPGPPGDYDYDRRPPRGYRSPGREDYRRRSPPRESYYSHPRYDRSPPRGGPRPPVEDYGAPPRPRYPEEAYDTRPPPPPRGAGRYEEPYANGHGHGGYGRPPYAAPGSPRRRSPGRPPYDGYERPRHW